MIGAVKSPRQRIQLDMNCCICICQDIIMFDWKLNSLVAKLLFTSLNHEPGKHQTANTHHIMRRTISLKSLNNLSSSDLLHNDSSFAGFTLNGEIKQGLITQCLSKDLEDATKEHLDQIYT